MGTGVFLRNRTDFRSRGDLNKTMGSGINFNFDHADGSFEVRVDGETGYKDDLLQFLHCQATLLESNAAHIKTTI
jgi:hypothetical protein